MKLVTSIHHAALRVADLNEAFERWSRLLGLHGERFADYALLRCTHEDFCLVLRQSSQKPGVDTIAYELMPGLTLVEAKAELTKREVKVQEVAVPLREKGLALADSDGNGIVLLNATGPKIPAPLR